MMTFHNNTWYRHTGASSVIVFVHGILSDSDTCWRKPGNGLHQSVFWPELITTDSRAGNPDIFLGGYYTAVDAADYDLHACASELYGALSRAEAVTGFAGPLAYQNIVFVCHSTGGIVTRYLIEKYASYLEGKRVGIVLIASPSRGSHLADILASLASLYGNRLGEQLQWNNESLVELDRRFKDLVHNPSRKFELIGAEGYENHFVLHRKLLPDRLRVVTEESAGRYFGAPTLLRQTDHFNVVKPDGLRHPTHEFLIDFISKFQDSQRHRPSDALKQSDEADSKGIVGSETSLPAWAPPYACAGGNDEHGRWIEIRIEGVTQRLRWIEPGEFWMGSPPGEIGHEATEGPRHRVKLTEGYWLADTVCTQALWHTLIDDNPSEFKSSPENPVETVTWDEAQEFLNRLQSLLPGCTPALPTEAEWEYACRAGTETPFNFGETITDKQANFRGTHPYPGVKKGRYLQQTVPVKKFPPNSWGLYQMHGNVWEWCADDLRSYEGTEIDPVGPIPENADANRVVRGGSWRSEGWRLRSAYRNIGYRGKRFSFHGFRFLLKPQRMK